MCFNSFRIRISSAATICCGLLFHAVPVNAQESSLRFGQEVPADVEAIYDSGLKWLVANQHDDGSWEKNQTSHNTVPGNAGIHGLCVMALLASGDDPNFGRYAKTIHKGLRYLIGEQDSATGYLPGSMYQHGFATLALAEAYGTVSDELVWKDDPKNKNRRSIGEALELAVRCAVTSQKDNPWKSWRYSPRSQDADTSVAGAVLMGLLAARNAGIEVPDESIEGALEYFDRMTSKRGGVAYAGAFGGFGSNNLVAIATLVNAIGKRKDSPKYAATLRVLSRGGGMGVFSANAYPFYNRYYVAQALFQGDFDAWKKWNRSTIRGLRKLQKRDGSFDSPHGKPYGTAMSLLSLALNYRFLPIYER